MSGRVAFVGVGAIARSMVVGLLEDREDEVAVRLTRRSVALSTELKSRFPQVVVVDEPRDSVEGARVVVVAVPPAQQSVLRELHLSSDQVLVSVLAGVPLQRLRELVGDGPSIVRAIPLPAVAQRATATALFPAEPDVEALFSLMGGSLAVRDESTLDAFSAVTGTIAAQLRFLAVVAEWLTEKGVPRAEADRYVAAMSAGLAPALTTAPGGLLALAEEHITPGGLNQQFLQGMTDAGTWTTIGTLLDGLLRRTVH